MYIMCIHILLIQIFHFHVNTLYILFDILDSSIQYLTIFKLSISIYNLRNSSPEITLKSQKHSIAKFSFKTMLSGIQHM